MRRNARIAAWAVLLLAGVLTLGAGAVLQGEGSSQAEATLQGNAASQGGAALPGESGSAPDAQPTAVVLEVKGPIGPATTNYLSKGMDLATERDATLVVLQMDTPGGLLDSTRDIINAILASDIPVATYVSPTGSRAASAGTFILYGSHVAAMAPGTTMGAATPVQMGGAASLSADASDARQVPGLPGQEAPEEEVDDTVAPAPEPGAAEEKMIEDAVSYIRSLASLRDRNADWAERAVREAATATDEEALEEGAIDVRAESVADLLEQVDGMTVVVGSDREEVDLETAGAEIVERPPDWVDEILSLITNPNVALIFMMLGVYGLFFEFANPGAVFPGVMGGIFLLMGLYALNVLPISYAGLALVLLGVALMTAEAFAPSFGILGIGGLMAFALGALMLFDVPDATFAVSGWTVGFMTAVSGLVLIGLLGYLWRSQARPVASGDREALAGTMGVVNQWSGGRGRVLLRGEWWNAEGAEDLAEGDEVEVTSISGLTLTVRRRVPAEPPGGAGPNEPRS